MGRVSTVLLAVILVAAGCGDSGAPAPTPDLAIGMQGADAATQGGDAAVGGNDMALEPINLGKQILAGKGFQIRGCTDDDHIIYSNPAYDLLSTDLSGAAPTTIATQVDIPGIPVGRWSKYFIIDRDTIFFWEHVDLGSQGGGGSGLGDFSAWNTAGQGKRMLAARSMPGYAAATTDGGYILYTADAANVGLAVDLYAAKVDGSGATKVLSQAFAGATDPMVGNGLAFGAAGSIFLVAYNNGIPAAPDGGVLSDGGTAPTASSTIAALEPKTGRLTTLKSPAAPFFSISPDGKNALVADPGTGGVFYSMPVAGGKATTIGNRLATATILADNRTVLYTNADTAVLKSTIAGGKPTSLVTMGIQQFVPTLLNNNLAISSDGKYAVGSATRDSTLNIDLSLIDLTRPGPPMVLERKAGALHGDAFTQDGSRILYYTNNATFGATRASLGQFFSMPVVGGMPTQLGKTVWLGFAGKGTRVVFNDNYKGDKTGRSNGQADLIVVDAGAGNPTPMALATQAEVDFCLSHDRGTVIYAYNTVAGSEGLYTTPVP